MAKWPYPIISRKQLQKRPNVNPGEEERAYDKKYFENFFFFLLDFKKIFSSRFSHSSGVSSFVDEEMSQKCQRSVTFCKQIVKKGWKFETLFMHFWRTLSKGFPFQQWPVSICLTDEVKMKWIFLKSKPNIHKRFPLCLCVWWCRSFLTQTKNPHDTYDANSR